MKLFLKAGTLIFLFSSVIARGQNITLSVTNQPIQKVFLVVEKQTGYNFIYTDEVISKASPVTLSVKNEPLDRFLQLCFEKQPLAYRVHDKHITVHEISLPTNDSIFHGRVVDEKGEPVAGATVAIKGNAVSTSTDLHGEFTIKDVSGVFTLLVTGAEIDPVETTIDGQSYIIISVKARTGTLDETVVIAYGKTTKRLSTGDVSRMKGEEIAKQPVSNPLAALQGRVPGLFVSQSSGVPGSNITVRLRGQNSIANGNDPLYIVDGVPFTSATLTSSIGGGAGVVSSPLNNINPLDIESIEVLKDADATAIYGSRGANGVILITTRKAKQGQTAIDLSVYTGIGQSISRLKMLSTAEYLTMRHEAFTNDGTTPTISNAIDLFMWDTTRYTDWQKTLFGNTFSITDINGSVTGGSPLTQFIVGAGYHKEGTSFPGNFGEEKISGHFGLNHVSTNQRFSLSLQGNYIKTNNVLPQLDLSGFMSLPPIAPPIYTSEGRLNWQNSTWVNPMSYTQRRYSTFTDNFITNLVASYRIWSTLQLKLSLGFNSISLREHVVMPSSAFDPVNNVSGSAIFGNSSIVSTIIEPQAVYNRKVLKGNVQVLTGLTLQNNQQNGLLQMGSGYTSDALLNSLKAASTITTNSDKSIRYKYTGLFARINYEWDSKYLLTLTARRDGSTRFGPANRFSNFGSVGAGWIFTKEKFFPLHFISFGKLKISWGTTGNDQIGDYKYLDTYSSYTYGYQGTGTLVPTQLFNPAYGWEQVSKLESGLDLGMFRDRLLVTLNFYRNTTSNQLVSYALANVTGFDGILENIPATIRNTGLEVDINGTILKTKNWKWAGGINVTAPKNKLVSYQNLAASTYANTYVIGQPLFIIKRYEYTGVDPTTGVYQFTDYNKDGSINAPADQQKIVFTGQRFFGGLQQSVEYKKWSLSFFVQFVRQPGAANYLGVFSRVGTISNQPAFVMNRWQKPGDKAPIQRFANSNPPANTGFNFYRSSDAAYTDGSYIRLKNVYFSWRVISNGTLFIQAQNLITLTGYKGLDPETKTVLPPARIFTAGIQLHL